MDDDVCLFGDCFGFCMQEFPLKSNNDQWMEDAKSKKNQPNKNTSPKPQNHRKCFIFEMTIPHIGDEQRVPKRGNVCIESGQLNNKK